jgi:2'-5' RNA ligase
MSTVPIRPDWSHDDRRCLSIVSFVPEELAQAIQTKVTQPLRALSPDHYFYPACSLHLTIKNVRSLNFPPNFDESDIAAACSIAREVAESHSPIEFELTELAPFSTSVSLIGYCSEKLRRLVRDLDKALRIAGIPDDKRYASDSVFFGNITVCRLTRPISKDTAASIRALELGPSIKFVVSCLTVASFDSVCHADSLQVAANIDLT